MQEVYLSVWVVDDEPGMCRAAKRSIEGYTDTFHDLDKSVVYHAEMMGSGEEFLERHKTVKPDILLLDGKLPGIDGFGVLERLHASKSMPVTVMITAYASYEKAVQATRLGAWDFLPKPFSPEELRSTIRKAARNVLLTNERQRLEDARRKLRFNFLSVLAHELKAPLNAIDGYVKIIQEREAGLPIETFDEMIERIGFRTTGMRKLIGDLLDLTRIEAGEGKRLLEPLCIRKCAETVVEQHVDAALGQNITVTLDIDAALEFVGDRAEIEMLLGNLLSNAIKYNKPGGSVGLAVRSSGGVVRITCSDTGIGMTQEECGMLFREFSRVKNEKTRLIPGSGLGLSIVQTIVNRYHGTVTVESVPETGTTFIVELLPD